MFARGAGPFLALAAAMIVAALVLTVVLMTVRLSLASFVAASIGLILLLVAGILLMNFFQDPERQIAEGIVAPADGRIQAVTTEGKLVRVETFMNVHNVHVNRAPLDGTVSRLVHHDGGHAPAYGPDALRNERVEITLQTDLGPVEVIQIAGLLARRIVPYVAEGSAVKRGERIGIIRFGSRVDLVLPALAVKVAVAPGQNVNAGSTCIAIPLPVRDDTRRS